MSLHSSAFFSTRTGLSLIAALTFLAACANRNDAGQPPQTVASRPPDATVEMRELQIAFIGSGDGGSGVLHYQGHDYPIRIAGLGVGGIGASRIDAEGEVYNLGNVSHFPGTYGRARYGYAAGNVGGGEMWLENGSGVVMHLRAKREGLMLSLGGDAIIVSMR